MQYNFFLFTTELWHKKKNSSWAQILSTDAAAATGLTPFLIVSNSGVLWNHRSLVLSSVLAPSLPEVFLTPLTAVLIITATLSLFHTHTHTLAIPASSKPPKKPSRRLVYKTCLISARFSASRFPPPYRFIRNMLFPAVGFFFIAFRLFLKKRKWISLINLHHKTVYF